jgi:hypothetical protein
VADALRAHNSGRGRRLAQASPKRGNMLTTVLIIILILLLLGAFPSWPYSRGWGYGPSGVVGLILIILLILLLLGKI